MFDIVAPFSLVVPLCFAVPAVDAAAVETVDFGPLEDGFDLVMLAVPVVVALFPSGLALGLLLTEIALVPVVAEAGGALALEGIVVCADEPVLGDGFEDTALEAVVGVFGLLASFGE